MKPKSDIVDNTGAFFKSTQITSKNPIHYEVLEYRYPEKIKIELEPANIISKQKSAIIFNLT